jgi:hypothetical protein
MFASPRQSFGDLRVSRDDAQIRNPHERLKIGSDDTEVRRPMIVGLHLDAGAAEALQNRHVRSLFV